MTTVITTNTHIDEETPVYGFDLTPDCPDGIAIHFGGSVLIGSADVLSDKLTEAIGEIIAIRARWVTVAAAGESAKAWGKLEVAP